jgi:hypothetical protein
VKASTSEDEYYEVNKNAVNVPGFVSLNQLLSKHVEVPEIYHLVISLLLRHPVAGICYRKNILVFLDSEKFRIVQLRLVSVV